MSEKNVCEVKMRIGQFVLTELWVIYWLLQRDGDLLQPNCPLTETIGLVQIEEEEGQGILYHSSARQNQQSTGFHNFFVMFSLFSMIVYAINAAN